MPLDDPARYAAFDALAIPEKVRLGWIVSEVSRVLTPKFIVPRGDLPVGTVSLEAKYYITTAGGDRWMLVKTHAYQLPDGSVRGGPDPLYIRLGAVTFTRSKHRPRG